MSDFLFRRPQSTAKLSKRRVFFDNSSERWQGIIWPLTTTGIRNRCDWDSQYPLFGICHQADNEHKDKDVHTHKDKDRDEWVQNRREKHKASISTDSDSEKDKDKGGEGDKDPESDLMIHILG